MEKLNLAERIDSIDFNSIDRDVVARRVDKFSVLKIIKNYEKELKELTDEKDSSNLQ